MSRKIELSPQHVIEVFALAGGLLKLGADPIDVFREAFRVHTAITAALATQGVEMVAPNQTFRITRDAEERTFVEVTSRRNPRGSA